jgi:hypothetical protein
MLYNILVLNFYKLMEMTFSIYFNIFIRVVTLHMFRTKILSNLEDALPKSLHFHPLRFTKPSPYMH